MTNAMSKTENNVDTELEIRRIETRADVLISISSHFFKCVTIVFVVYFGYLSIDSLAGEITNTNFIVGLFSDKYFANVVCILAAVFAILYGRKQSKLRKDVVERYDKYMRNEELAADPNRSSSHMDTRGENRLEQDQ